jgi:predicted nucleotidyltransferase
MVSRSSITLPANGFVAELSPLLRLAFPEAIAAYAFGSRVLGTARPDSDLDVAVLLPGYADPLQLWEAASQLAQLAGCAVDLLDLRAATTVMQHQVLTQGLTLFASQPTAGLFECFVMAEKLSLDEARMNLLNDIAATGSVYGR